MNNFLKLLLLFLINAAVFCQNDSLKIGKTDTTSTQIDSTTTSEPQILHENLLKTAKNPRDPNFNRGVVAFEKHNFTDAEKYFTRSINRNEYAWYSYFNLALTYLNLQDQENACKNFRKYRKGTKSKKVGKLIKKYCE